MPGTNHRGYRELVDQDGPVQRAAAREWRRWFAPFALLVCVFLLGMTWLVRSGGSRAMPVPTDCSGEEWKGLRQLHKVATGETCWHIAGEEAGLLKKMIDINPQADCNALVPGQLLCVPLKV